METDHLYLDSEQNNSLESPRTMAQSRDNIHSDFPVLDPDPNAQDASQDILSGPEDASVPSSIGSDSPNPVISIPSFSSPSLDPQWALLPPLPSDFGIFPQSPTSKASSGAETPIPVVAASSPFREPIRFESASSSKDISYSGFPPNDLGLQELKVPDAVKEEVKIQPLLERCKYPSRIQECNIAADKLKKARRKLVGFERSQAEIREYISLSDSFFIDGDALLLLFSTCDGPIGSPYQTLSLFYLVERYLADVKQFGGQFVVVFFNTSIFAYMDSDPIWIAISQNLRRHLQQVTSLTVETVDSCQSAAYETLLKKWNPGFLLTSVNRHLSGGKSISKKLMTAHIIALKNICFHLGSQITVGDVDDLKFDDSTRLTIIETWSGVKARTIGNQLKLPGVPQVFDVLKALYSNTNAQVPSNWLLDALIATHPHLESYNIEKDIWNVTLVEDRSPSWLSTMIDVALRIALSTGLISPSIVKTLLIYAILQAHLGIYDRVELKDTSSEKSERRPDLAVSAFVRLLIWVNMKMLTLPSYPQSMRFDVADLFDLDLYERILSHLHEFGTFIFPSFDPHLEINGFSTGAKLMMCTESVLGFNDTMMKELKKRWEYITTELSVDIDPVHSTKLDCASEPLNRFGSFFPMILEDLPMKENKVIAAGSLAAASSSSSSTPISPPFASASPTPIVQPLPLWPVRYRLVDAVLSADGTPPPTLTEEDHDRHSAGISPVLEYEDKRHWRSGRLIMASEAVYKDDDLRGKGALQRYIKGLAKALDSKNPPAMPPLLNEKLFSEVGMADFDFEDSLEEDDPTGAAGASPDLKALDIDELRSSLQSVASKDPETHLAAIDRLKHLVLLNCEIYQRLESSPTTKSEISNCIVQVIDIIFKAVECLLPTIIWSEFGLESLFNQACDIMRLDVLKRYWIVSSPVTVEKEAFGKFIRLQLSHMGPLMQKDTDSVPDSRVSFRPDPWQVKVLNGIDSDKSLLVIAPTSSGKSFISFYAMERQLKRSENSVVIFVAPTVALVNQVQAEISLKFGDKYPQKGEISIFGSFTRDMRVVPTNCRVLVTVPACLEILLLSPPLQLQWVPRIRCIIFDEIHTISADESSILARMLALAPCPFIALSATIGCPEIFHDYLKTLSEREVEVVDYAKRYNDIEKHVIDLVPASSTTQAKNASKAEKSKNKIVGLEIRHWHPWTGAKLAHFEQGTPPVSFSPSDSLLLYEAMERTFSAFEEAELVQEADISAVLGQIPSLAPEVFFADLIQLSQSHTRRYEAELKQWFQRLVEACKKHRQPEAARKVLDEINAPLANRQDADGLYSGGSKEVFSENIDKVVQRLYDDDKLPAIIFNFSRPFCERIAEALYDVYLVQDGIDPKEKHSGDSSSSSNPPKGGKAKKVPKAKLCRLTNDGEIMPVETLQKELKELKSSLQASKDGSSFLWAVDAIQYGIGIHHGGMRKEYKDAVERYFRLRQIKVVFATGTLAVGINMPCRSTVFMGDSPHLTPQQYRQMSGRSGRRGVDSLGHAYFWGIHDGRIAHLELSQLSPIASYFPLSISTTLRATILDSYHRSLPPKKAAKLEITNPSARLFNLYRKSLYLHGHDERWAQIWIHTACTMEYLASEGMLTLDGTPINLAGLVSHISWTEPSNLVIAKFLISPLARQMAQEWKTNKDKICDTLIHFFATLFNRERGPQLDKNMEQNIKSQGCDHSIVLEPLPPELAQFNVEHRAQCFDIANRVIKRFVESHMESTGDTKHMHHPEHPHQNFGTRIDPVVLREETALPLSGEDGKLKFEPYTLNVRESQDGTTSIGEQPTSNGTLVSRLLDNATAPKILSPFVSMTSKRDRIISVSDLRLLRSGLQITNLALLSNQETLIGSEESLNSYVLDMYRFGKYDWLVKFNRIRPNDLRRNLKDVMLNLLVIAKAASYFFKQPNDWPLVHMLRDVSKRFQDQYAKLFVAEFFNLAQWDEVAVSAPKKGNPNGSTVSNTEQLLLPLPAAGFPAQPYVVNPISDFLPLLSFGSPATATALPQLIQPISAATISSASPTPSPPNEKRKSKEEKKMARLEKKKTRLEKKAKMDAKKLKKLRKKEMKLQKRAASSSPSIESTVPASSSTTEESTTLSSCLENLQVDDTKPNLPDNSTSQHSPAKESDEEYELSAEILSDAQFPPFEDPLLASNTLAEFPILYGILDAQHSSGDSSPAPQLESPQSPLY